MAECGPSILPEYKCGSPIKGNVLVILFPDPKKISDNMALSILRTKIETTFAKIGYQPLKWEGYDLLKTKRIRFLGDIEKVAHGLQSSESFAMVIISSQKNGRIQMTSGEDFEMEEVYLKFNAESCTNLKCKPKIFVFDTHPYEVIHRGTHQSARSAPLPFPEFSGKVPLEADMLVVHSIEGNMVKPDSTTNVTPCPSFINALIEVLENDFNKENGHKDILELMVDVSDKVLQLNGPDSPIPMVLSTLTSQYYLK